MRMRLSRFGRVADWAEVGLYRCLTARAHVRFAVLVTCCRVCVYVSRRTGPAGWTPITSQLSPPIVVVVFYCEMYSVLVWKGFGGRVMWSIVFLRPTCHDQGMFRFRLAPPPTPLGVSPLPRRPGRWSRVARGASPRQCPPLTVSPVRETGGSAKSRVRVHACEKTHHVRTTGQQPRQTLPTATYQQLC